MYVCLRMSIHVCIYVIIKRYIIGQSYAVPYCIIVLGAWPPCLRDGDGPGGSLQLEDDHSQQQRREPCPHSIRDAAVGTITEKEA